MKSQSQNKSQSQLNSVTAMMLDSSNSGESIIKALKGLEIDEKTNNGSTALALAANQGKLDVVKYLIGHGAKIDEKNNNGYTALINATYKGHLDIVKCLVGAGAKLDEKNNYGYTAFMFAANQGKLDVVEYLFGQGAKINEKNNNGSIALVRAADQGKLDVVEYLIGKGAKLNEKDKGGNTALMCLANQGKLDVVEYLICQGAKLDEKNNDGSTALMHAANQGKLDVVEYLIGQGAKLDEKNNTNYTALDLAAEEGRLDVLRYLVALQLSKTTLGDKLSFIRSVIRYEKSSSNHVLMKIRSSRKDTQIGDNDIIEIYKDAFVQSLIPSNFTHLLNDRLFLKSLFADADSSLSTPSPCDTFNILSDIKGNGRAFQTSFAPSKNPLKKNIILDRKSFDTQKKQIPLSEQLSIVEMLVKNDFNVYLCTQNAVGDLDFKSLSALMLDQKTLELKTLLQDQNLPDFLLNEDLFNKLAHINPSISSDNITNPDAEKLFAISALAYVNSYDLDEYFNASSKKIENKEEDELFKNISQKEFKIIETILAENSSSSEYHRYYIVLGLVIVAAIGIYLNHERLATMAASHAGSSRNSAEGMLSHVTQKVSDGFDATNVKKIVNIGYAKAAEMIYDQFATGDNAITESISQTINSLQERVIDASKDVQTHASLNVHEVDNKIKVATNTARNSVISDAKEHKPTYAMQDVGEILNGDISNIQTRTSVQAYHVRENEGIILRDLDENDIDFAGQNPQNIVLIQDSDIERYKRSTDFTYFKFSENLIANRRVRLFSASSQDSFSGVLGDIEGLTIEKGSDSFFYATSTKDRLLSYVIHNDHPQNTRVEELLPADHPIQRIIEDYMNPAKGFAYMTDGNQTMPQIENGNVRQWLDAIYEKRSGVCRHRSVAVYHKIVTQNPEQAKNVRILGINNNHVILEVREGENSPWLKYDLGGGEAERQNSDQSSSEASNYKYNNDLNTPNVRKQSSEFVETQSMPDENQPDEMLTPTSMPSSEVETSHQDNSEDRRPSWYGNDWDFVISTSIFLMLGFMENIATSLKSETKTQDSHNLPQVQDLETGNARASENRESQMLEQKINSDLARKISAKTTDDLKKRLKFEVVDNAYESVRKNQKTLVLNDNIRHNAHFLIEQFSKDNKDVFYLDSPHKIFQNRVLQVNAQDDVHINHSSLLVDFITTLAGRDAAIIIDWSAFNNNQVLALNTIIDRNPKIGDYSIASNIQIVSLIDRDLNDPSFLSRHNALISKKGNHQSDMVETLPKSELAEIDLEGAVAWREKLFGEIQQNSQEITWEKGPLCHYLEEGCDHMTIKNIAAEALEEFSHEIAEAKARGYFNYNGYQIACLASLKIDFARNEFDFSKFSIHAQNNVSYSNKLPKDIAVINTHFFDLLLKKNSIDEKGNYKVAAGLIKERAGQDLNLFITSQLTNEQYYCLFHEALKNNVSLHLFTAKGVNLPTKLHVESMPNSVLSDPLQAKTPVIIATNNSKEALKEVLAQNDIYAVIDVEDYDYAQLFSEIEFKRTQSGYHDFKEVKSDFLKALEAGHKIVLKGEFPPEFLLVLHSLFCSSEEKPSLIAQNLSIIIEDNKIRPNQTNYRPLDFLGTQLFNVKGYDIEHKADKSDLQFVEEGEKDGQVDLENSAMKAKEFMRKRKENLTQNLQQNAMIQLLGHSGVGKSHFMQELETSASGYRVFHELSNFEDWANDESDNVKILFIDESNLEDAHLTKFSPLKALNLAENSDHKVTLLWNKKLYEVGQNHKVVFARNPKNYSAGRVAQKLFDDAVPVLYFKDFSSSYIYEAILKAPIFDQLSETIKAEITLEQFKKVSERLIAEYQHFNQEKRANNDDINCKTVRELQESLLNFINDSQMPDIDANQTIKSDTFISTDATAGVEKSLSDFISIRKRQREGTYGKNAVGLNGFIISGDAGLGKTELIRSILESRNITQAHMTADDKAQKYYKIEASMPIEEKKEIIMKAYEGGDVVWIDEINSCINDGGLEKILNDVLTGKHPGNGDNRDVTPGFMMISSVNSAFWSGRSQLSPAIKHRSVMCNATRLKDYALKDLEDITQHCAQASLESLPEDYSRQTIISSIAQSFQKELAENEGCHLSLRDLNDVIPSVIADIRTTLPSQNPGLDDASTLSKSELRERN